MPESSSDEGDQITTSERPGRGLFSSGDVLTRRGRSVIPPAHLSNSTVIDDSPYYVFVALCIVVIVVSLIKIAASNENIECFANILLLAIAHLTLAFLKVLARVRTKNKPS